MSLVAGLYKQCRFTDFSAPKTSEQTGFSWEEERRLQEERRLKEKEEKRAAKEAKYKAKLEEEERRRKPKKAPFNFERVSGFMTSLSPRELTSCFRIAQRLSKVFPRHRKPRATSSTLSRWVGPGKPSTSLAKLGMQLVNTEKESLQENVRVQECLAKAKQVRKSIVRYIQVGLPISQPTLLPNLAATSSSRTKNSLVLLSRPTNES